MKKCVQCNLDRCRWLGECNCSGNLLWRSLVVEDVGQLLLATEAVVVVGLVVASTLTAAADAEDHVERRTLGDPVISKGLVVLKLRAREDDAEVDRANSRSRAKRLGRTGR